jgi:hypothetical protein
VLSEFEAAKKEKDTLYSAPDEEKGKEFLSGMYEHLAAHIVLKEHKLRYQEEQN